MNELRDYQNDNVSAIRAELGNSHSALSVLPCGAGKTVIFSDIAQRALQRGKKTLILVNQIRLLEQAKIHTDKFTQTGIYNGTMGIRNIYDVTIATNQSLRRLSILEKFDLLILDEVHSQFKYLKKYLNDFPGKIIGFTATPFNHKGFIYGEKEFFHRVCFELSYAYMIENKYLVPLVFSSPDCQVDLTGVRTSKGDYLESDLRSRVLDLTQIQTWDAESRTQNRKKILWVCLSIEHAEMVASFLPNPSLYHSKNNQLLNFTDGNSRHLVTVMKAAEGFDFPPMDALVLLRPTKSPVLFKQLSGRILRPYPGKDDGLLLDYGQAIKNLGDPLSCEPKVREERGKSKSIRVVVSEGKTWEDSIENLTETPYSTDDEDTFEVENYFMSNYISKKGNRTFKISYRCKDRAGFVTEYIMCDRISPGITLEEYEQKHFKKPLKIKTKYQNGYVNIARKIYGRQNQEFNLQN